MDIKTLREAFQPWAISEGYSVELMADGNYRSKTQLVWVAWLACHDYICNHIDCSRVQGKAY